MFGAIAGGIASALAGGAMSKLFGGGQKAASGGIQGDVLATDNNTVGMGDAGIKSAIQELNPLFTINVTMRDIKSKNVYSRVNSKATTQWRKTESANGVHLEGVASDNRSS